MSMQETTSYPSSAVVAGRLTIRFKTSV